MSPTNSNPADAEQLELDLSRPEDLQLFRESAEEVAAEGMQLEPVAQFDNYRRLTDGDISGEEVFNTLQEKLEQLCAKIEGYAAEISGGQNASETSVTEMQQLYDDVINLRNHIETAYGVAEMVGRTTVEPKETVKLEVVESTTQTPVEPAQATSAQMSDTQAAPSVTSLEPILVEASVPDPVTPNRPSIFESERLSTTGETPVNLVELATEDDYDIRIDKLLANIDFETSRVRELERRLLPADSAAHDLLKELPLCFERSQLLRERLRDLKFSHEDPMVLKAKLSTYERVMTEMIKNINNFEQVAQPVEDLQQVTPSSVSTTISGQPTVTEAIEPSTESLLFREVPLVQRETVVPIVSEAEASAVNESLLSVNLNNLNQPTDMFQGGQSLHKAMSISTEEGAETIIPIMVVPRKESDQSKKQGQNQTRLGILSGKTLSKYVSGLTTTRDERRALAKLERNDPVNRAVSGNNSRLVTPDSQLERESLTERYLTSPRHKAFIDTYYSSPKGFEKIIDLTVTQLEATTTDPIERWLKEKRISPFTRLQNKTLAEIERLVEQPDIRERLTRANIKYETFVMWVDLIGEMMSVTNLDQAVTFGQLFATWMIESEMAYEAEWDKQRQSGNSQVDELNTI